MKFSKGFIRTLQRLYAALHRFYFLRCSITAIAKLAPNAKIGEGLSVHYSGGSSLSKDVAKWLEKNGVKTK